ncbi:Na/Pi-cotransporter II-like protein [Pandoraea capi]|uniref:Na/Pi-cotransporter II-like protein n=1 Tax=Pandoraea capi TaxID=2508286 RepID=A0ABY6VX20_9BURK|nr:Na/Pi symporter [Pandoraea capi]VVD99319.1 Na/Pi-cotransporter II-like protein [Pandoraea capi]
MGEIVKAVSILAGGVGIFLIGMAGMIRLPDGEGPLDVLLQVVVGFVLTCIVQSSAAAMAIMLTAAQNGLLSAQGAAAVVIGANVGTTDTAVIAAIGATPNARRASMAHVAFKVVAAAVALLLLPWMIRAIATGMSWTGYAADPAIKLAIFHTTFNALGVLLMIPLAVALLHAAGVDTVMP